jgi:hypothetical protein
VVANKLEGIMRWHTLRVPYLLNTVILLYGIITFCEGVCAHGLDLVLDSVRGCWRTRLSGR